MTSAPDRRRTSIVITASIGSVPFAIGTKTYINKIRRSRNSMNNNNKVIENVVFDTFLAAEAMVAETERKRWRREEGFVVEGAKWSVR